MLYLPALLIHHRFACGPPSPLGKACTLATRRGQTPLEKARTFATRRGHTPLGKAILCGAFKVPDKHQFGVQFLIYWRVMCRQGRRDVAPSGAMMLCGFATQ